MACNSAIRRIAALAQLARMPLSSSAAPAIARTVFLRPTASTMHVSFRHFSTETSTVTGTMTEETTQQEHESVVDHHEEQDFAVNETSMDETSSVEIDRELSPEARLIGVNKAMYEAAKQNQTLKCYTLLARAQESGLTPDTYTFNALISSASGNPKRLMRLLDGFEAHNVELNQPSFNACMKICGQASSVDVGLQVLERMAERVNLTNFAMRQLFMAASRGKYEGVVEKALELADRNGLELERVTYGMALSACPDVESAEKVFNVATEKTGAEYSGQPDILYNNMLSVYSKHSLIDKAEQLVDRLAENGVDITRVHELGTGQTAPSMCEPVIRAAVQAQDYDRVNSLFQKYMDLGYRPSSDICSLVLISIVREDFEKAILFYRRIRSWGVPCPPGAFVSLLDHAFAQGRDDMVSYLVTEAREATIAFKKTSGAFTQTSGRKQQSSRNDRPRRSNTSRRQPSGPKAAATE